MFGLFNKKSPEEIKKVNLFTSIVKQLEHVDRFSYRKNGKFEIICERGMEGGLQDPENQCQFNLLYQVWAIIWNHNLKGGYDYGGNFQDRPPKLHVGMVGMIRRLEIGASQALHGHKFPKHKEMEDELLATVGVKRKVPRFHIKKEVNLESP